jgi:hypothetical protein
MYLLILGFWGGMYLCKQLLPFHMMSPVILTEIRLLSVFVITDFWIPV